VCALNEQTRRKKSVCAVAIHQPSARHSIQPPSAARYDEWCVYISRLQFSSIYIIFSNFSGSRESKRDEKKIKHHMGVCITHCIVYFVNFNHIFFSSLTRTGVVERKSIILQIGNCSERQGRMKGGGGGEWRRAR
jgi:hypothetical protein